eukprot:scaffold43360_cov27-Tisochrysis_lutea.AAC.1
MHQRADASEGRLDACHRATRKSITPGHRVRVRSRKTEKTADLWDQKTVKHSEKNSGAIYRRRAFPFRARKERLRLRLHSSAPPPLLSVIHAYGRSRCRRPLPSPRPMVSRSVFNPNPTRASRSLRVVDSDNNAATAQIARLRMPPPPRPSFLVLGSWGVGPYALPCLGLALGEG